MSAKMSSLALSLLLALPLAAGAGVGQIKTVKGSVQIERAGQSLPATVGMNVEQSDRIVTGADGATGISFEDNSVLSLGPGSDLAISRFNFDSTTHEGVFETSLQKGTLSAVSGKIAKQTPEAMKIRTPTTVLGVRGTEFFVQVVDAPR